jgi:hypothetical protein
MRTVSSFLIAVLAALGLEQMLRPTRAVSMRRWFTVGAVGSAVVVAYLAVNSAMEPAFRHQRFAALVWPTICAIGCLGVCAHLWISSKDRTSIRSIRSVGVIALGLVAVESAFLFFAGVGIASYSKPFFQVTPAIAELKGIVGDSLVGLNGGNDTSAHGVRFFEGVGFYPNVNVGYSIRIFGVHDPTVPASYFASWPFQKDAPNALGVGLFVPDINSVSLARRYGITYVLTKAGVALPPGMTTVVVIAGETLSRVSDAQTFSFIAGSGDRVVSSTSNGDGAWEVVVSAKTAGTLALRVTAEPGFSATIDGRALPLKSLDDVMFKAEIPAGDHVITLRYHPRRLEVGVAGALVTLAAMAVWGIVALARRRQVVAAASIADYDGVALD